MSFSLADISKLKPAQQAVVNLLAKRARYSERCMRCGKPQFMAESAYWNYQYLAGNGCCFLFYCESCHNRLYPADAAARRRRIKHPKSLPLP